MRTPRWRWKLSCQWSVWEGGSCQRCAGLHQLCPVLYQQYADMCTEKELQFAVLARQRMDLVGFKGTCKPVYLHTQMLTSQIASRNSDVVLVFLIFSVLLAFLVMWVCVCVCVCVWGGGAWIICHNTGSCFLHPRGSKARDATNIQLLVPYRLLFVLYSTLPYYLEQGLMERPPCTSL